MHKYEIGQTVRLKTKEQIALDLGGIINIPYGYARDMDKYFGEEVIIRRKLSDGAKIGYKIEHSLSSFHESLFVDEPKLKIPNITRLSDTIKAIQEELKILYTEPVLTLSSNETWEVYSNEELVASGDCLEDLQDFFTLNNERKWKKS